MGNIDFNSEGSLEAGSEEDFIRQLQEQMANQQEGAPLEIAEEGNALNPGEEVDEEALAQEAALKAKKERKNKIKARLKAVIAKISTFAQYYLPPVVLLFFLWFVGLSGINRVTMSIFITIGAISTGIYYRLLLWTTLRRITFNAHDTLEQISKGNLAFSIEEDEELKKQLGTLAFPIDNVIKEMSSVVTKIQLSVMDIVGNSDALSYFANSMANKTSQQESAVIQIANSATDLNESMQDINSNVESAYNNSKTSIDEAEKSSDEIMLLINEMNSISDMSDQILATMNFINDIADETNLLALNAAIQAAHAGEEGRGFGVVASEIRALSESSSKATKEIFQIIGKTVQSIERGVEASEKSKKALKKIVNSIKATEDLMAEINQAIQAQSNTTDSLNSSVGNIQQLTSNINSDTQNMKSAITNLSGQAQILNNLIKGFETNSESVSSSAIFGVE